MRLAALALLVLSGCATANLGNDKAGDVSNASREEVLDALSEAMPTVETCYQSLLYKAPHAAGKIVVDFQGDRNGNASHVRVVADTVHDRAFSKCIRLTIRHEVTGLPPGAKIRYPLIFKSDGPPEDLDNRDDSTRIIGTGLVLLVLLVLL